MSTAGLFSLVIDGLAPELITRFRRAAHKQAFEEWVARRGFPGLGARFSEAYMAPLGLSPRSPKYVQRVMKKWGKYLPYVSPYRDSQHQHMMDLVRSDDGHRVSNKNSTPGLIVTVLKLVGARILNRLSGDQAKYRQQFLRLASSYGRTDREWIENRANELFMVALNARIDAEKEKAVRGRARAARLFAPGEAA
jgi:hypothetical protein